MTLALGGAADRVKQNVEKYLGALRAAVRSVKAEADFDTPIQIEQ